MKPLQVTLMTKPKDDQAVQKTQPKKGKPVEIPVPTRAAFLRNLKKVAPPVKPSRRHDNGAKQ